MEEGKGRGLLERVRTVRWKGEGWVCRACRMWGPRLPVAPIMAMFLRGVDIVGGYEGVRGWGLGIW